MLHSNLLDMSMQHWNSQLKPRAGTIRNHSRMKYLLHWLLTKIQARLSQLCWMATISMLNQSRVGRSWIIHHKAMKTSWPWRLVGENMLSQISTNLTHMLLWNTLPQIIITEPLYKVYGDMNKSEHYCHYTIMSSLHILFGCIIVCVYYNISHCIVCSMPTSIIL